MLVCLRPRSLCELCLSSTGIALGEYIYIDGGEVYYKENGIVYNNAANSTHPSPISESWTPGSVRLKRIDKGRSLVYNRENLWPSNDGKSIFTFNGDVSSTILSTSLANRLDSLIWKFVPDENGGGSWRLSSVANRLVQSVCAASTVANDSACMSIPNPVPLVPVPRYQLLVCHGAFTD